MPSGRDCQSGKWRERRLLDATQNEHLGGGGVRNVDLYPVFDQLFPAECPDGAGGDYVLDSIGRRAVHPRDMQPEERAAAGGGAKEKDRTFTALVQARDAVPELAWMFPGRF